MFNTFIERLLSLILPKDADILKIERMSASELAETMPEADPLPDAGHKALFHYKDPLVRAAIWEIKYKGNKIIAGKLAKLLHESIISQIADAAAFANFTDPLLVPIPASGSTIRERGFNQCELIAKELEKIDGKNTFTASFDALKKITDTPHQSKLKNRAERLKNLKGSFGADPLKIKDRNIILLDDVITTGATMREAEKTLRRAGAKSVICFALAH